MFRLLLVCFVLTIHVLCIAALPARRVDGNVLISDALPSIQIRIDPKIRCVGSFPFNIQDIAAGERYVFAEADGKTIKRMFIAQFESFLPESSEIYRYSFANAMKIKGHLFNHSTFAYSNQEALKENPKGEGALTASFLKAKGFDVQDEWIASRFLTLGDESRKHELILFYLEPAATTGHTIAEFYEGETKTKLFERISAELKQRSMQAFEILTQ
jgi:hypothetical protein